MEHQKKSKWGHAALVIMLACLTSCHEYTPEKWPTDRIERISGVRVPEYKVTKAIEGPTSFNGDYIDTLYIEFETMPSGEMFGQIDEMIEAGHPGWHKKGNQYSFTAIWGNGSPAPEGENEEDDRHFFLIITKGEKNGIITCGWW